MSYAQLLAALQKLTAAELERPARVLVTGHALAIRQVVDEGDCSPLLDTGVVMVEVAGGCE